MNLICQFGRTSHGEESTDLSGMSHTSHTSHMVHMVHRRRAEEAGQEQEEPPFLGEVELVPLVVEEVEQLKMEAHDRSDRRGSYLDNHRWNNHRPNDHYRHQKSLNLPVEHLHIVHLHLLHHKSDDVSDHLEPYHEFNLLIITSYATLISLNILSASSRLSVFLSGCHLSASFLYLDIMYFLLLLRFL